MPPSTMKAALLKGFGGPEVIALGEAPVPKPGPEDLLVRIRATALNRADTLQRKGLYAPPPGDSEILGLELAGEVEGWGGAVEGFSKGDRVFGLVGGGGYAEYGLLDHQMAIPVPKGWNFEQAAAVAEVFYTANETIFVLGGLRAGQAVLIHAGGSGVGTAGIQMAANAGARVFFTAGSADKIARAQALVPGARIQGIDYKKQEFEKAVLEATGGEGVDVILDFLGASYLARNLAALKTGGRLVVAALMGGAKSELDLGLVLRRRLQVIGSAMRSQPLANKRAITARFRQRWWPLLEQGKIVPVIDRVLPLAQARQAHEAMEANLNFGKIVLSV